MPIDLNNPAFRGTGGNFDPIPAGVVAPMVIQIEYDEETGSALRHSTKNTNAVWMKCKISITDGPYKGRRFYHNMTVQGGKLNANGDSIAGIIAGKTVRAIVESSRGISSTATDENSVKGRTINDWSDIHGMSFVGKVAIEPEKGQYPARNKLDRALPADHKDYMQVSNGQPQAPVAPVTVPEPVSPAPSPEPSANVSSEAPPWAR